MKNQGVVSEIIGKPRRRCSIPLSLLPPEGDGRGRKKQEDLTMPYSAKNYEFLFDQPCDGLKESAFEALRHKDVFRYRAKTIKSGHVLECEIYPLWNCRSEAQKARAATTREAQKNLNAKNARKNLTRKVNANFTEDDLCITLTYKGTVPDEEQARRDIRNYLRRVRDFRKKNGLSELKYIYVIEFEDGEGGRKKKRVHHHVIMSGMDRDTAEKIWGKGWANTRRLQPDEYGLEAIARYIVKEPAGSKRWCASRNLVDPQITKADTKLSKRQAEKLATDFDDAAPQIFGKLFPDYDFNDCEIHRSNYVAGAYIYARMHRRKSTPPKSKQKKPRKE